MSDTTKYDGPEDDPQTDELTPDPAGEPPQPSGPDDSNR